MNEGTEINIFKAVLVLLRAMLIPKVHLAVENLALRQQLAVCTVGTRGVLRDRKHPLAWLVYRSKFSTDLISTSIF